MCSLEDGFFPRRSPCRSTLACLRTQMFVYVLFLGWGVLSYYLLFFVYEWGQGFAYIPSSSTFYAFSTTYTHIYIYCDDCFRKNMKTKRTLKNYAKECKHHLHSVYRFAGMVQERIKYCSRSSCFSLLPLFLAWFSP